MARSPSIAHHHGEEQPSTYTGHLPAPARGPAPATAPPPSYSNVRDMKADGAHRGEDPANGSLSLGFLNMTSSLKSIFNEGKDVSGDGQVGFSSNLPFAWNFTKTPVPASGDLEGGGDEGSVGPYAGERELLASRQSSNLPSPNAPFSSHPPRSAAPLGFDSERVASRYTRNPHSSQST